MAIYVIAILPMMNAWHFESKDKRQPQQNDLSPTTLVRPERSHCRSQSNDISVWRWGIQGQLKNGWTRYLFAPKSRYSLKKCMRAILLDTSKSLHITWGRFRGWEVCRQPTKKLDAVPSTTTWGSRSESFCGGSTIWINQTSHPHPR